MFFTTGGAMPYMVYIFLIWGIFLLNAGLNFVSQKLDNRENNLNTPHYEEAQTYNFPVFTLLQDEDDQSDGPESSASFLSSFREKGLKLTLFNSPPGNTVRLPENRLLRSPPLFFSVL